ncbi:hypothetical protein DM860_015426 [Cuscuta australis]|uniref:Uncharacterized protein n=1 Tax=Cuscuta australis TaxID=267555 RepID=A0A328EAK8_9ASTE|nr:hypothetical protein DM860_015426 [Cuscuta australis]
MPNHIPSFTSFLIYALPVYSDEETTNYIEMVFMYEHVSYRIKKRVVDASGGATLVVFENVGCLLLHNSCSEMMKYCESLNIL